VQPNGVIVPSKVLQVRVGSSSMVAELFSPCFGTERSNDLCETASISPMTGGPEEIF
jgi:hypothetical protein